MSGFWSVDNASTGSVDDEHPCVSHTWVDGRCEDCYVLCEHDEQEMDGRGVFVCLICDEPVRMAEADDFGPDPYDVWKDSVIESGAPWPPWR